MNFPLQTERMDQITACGSCPLRAMSVFRRNTDEEIAFIASMRTDQIKVRAGQAITHEGAETSPLYSLFSGWAFRHKTLPDDRRQVLNFLVPGDVIGFQANMLGETVHGVEALTDVILCRHSREMVWPLYQTHPELAFDATWLTAKEESLVDEMLLSVGRRTASERIAMLMVHFFRRARPLQEGATDTVMLPITQQHIADALGLSLVHTNKTMRRLQRHGYFRFERQHLRMLDLQGLERLAQYFEMPARPRPLL